MKTILTLFCISFLTLSCTSKPERRFGNWKGDAIDVYEETVYSDSAKDLQAALGKHIVSEEIFQKDVAFSFVGDSVTITSLLFRDKFWVIPDKTDNQKLLLMGPMVVNMLVVRQTADSLVLEEMSGITVQLGADGHISAPTKERTHRFYRLGRSK